jgi:hypothetical protein
LVCDYNDKGSFHVVVNSKTASSFLWLIALQLSGAQTFAASNSESPVGSETVHLSAYQVYQELKSESSDLITKYSSTKDISYKQKINHIYDESRYSK